MPSNLLIVTGSETYAFDMGIAASRFTDVAVVRWTSVGQFEGSLFELFFITGGQVRKISSVKLPLRIRNKPEWFVSRVPLFVLNTWLMFSFAIKARRLLGKSNTRVSALGIGWGGGLITLFLKKLGLLDSFAYYRVDWFTGRPRHFYDSLIVNAYFRSIDRILSRTSNYVWNITEEVRAAANRTHMFLNRKEIVVRPPISRLGSYPDLPRTADPYIVYCGEVKPGCGLPLILSAISALLKQNNTMKLKILGRARIDYLASLQQEFRDVFDKGVCEYLGGFDMVNDGDKERINQIIAGAYAGVAIFPSGSSNTSNYVIPNRILLYLANHTPVIINSDAAAASWLCSAGVAVGTSTGPENIAKNVLMLRDSLEYRSWLRSNIGPFMENMGNEAESAKALGTLTGELAVD
ncbi:MAG: hypothetical protein AUJ07_11490 [Crenarchaeota archaeon 13_1_40CM_3_53_5]|nr:MAG: hypothetical protein AUJ07_11490 [Crenarchaeota archaeon 13_1_40CM_3_53_5]